jgi:hypothetical protein
MFINPEDCNLNNHHCENLKINVKILKIWPWKAIAGLICTIFKNVWGNKMES